MHIHKQCVLLVVLFFFVGKVLLNIMPSSVINRQETMPRPLKKIRRRHTEAATVVNESHTQIKKSLIPGQSIAPDDIWNWDYWCQLQVKKGNCTNYNTRYYYDVQIDECVNFPYSGCDGNKNNFKTIAECERRCRGASILSLKEEILKPCGMQPDAGNCLALAKSYYYDINSDDCKEFHYGGCGGNENRFIDKESCLRICNKSQVIKSP